MGRAIASVGDPKGVQGGERKAPLLAPQRENSAEEISLMGPDAPTPAREEGLQPYGALTLFFRWRKKSVQKKASGTATPGKRLLIAHFDGGARYVARNGFGQITPTIVRARSSPFSAVKMGGPFSLRCLSPLCSPAVGGGQAYPLRVGMLRCGPTALPHKNEDICFPHSWR